jgi:osmotically-inducible protein OsmY
MNKIFLLSLSFLALMGLSACVGAAVGAGAAVGVAAAREGGVQSSIVDESIRLKISDRWFRHDVDMFNKLNLSVNQGRVLITGVVQKPEDRVEAVRLAWQVKGVKQIINEIQIGKDGNVGNFAEDAWIATQLRARFIFTKEIQSVNYSIEVVRGIVYLMGIAQNQRELDIALRTARTTQGVKQVISYVKLVGEDVDRAGAAPVPLNSSDMNSQMNSEMSSGMNENTAPIYPDPSQGPLPSGSFAAPPSVQSEILPP